MTSRSAISRSTDLFGMESLPTLTVSAKGSSTTYKPSTTNIGVSASTTEDVARVCQTLTPQIQELLTEYFLQCSKHGTDVSEKYRQYEHGILQSVGIGCQANQILGIVLTLQGFAVHFQIHEHMSRTKGYPFREYAFLEVDHGGADRTIVAPTYLSLIRSMLHPYRKELDSFLNSAEPILVVAKSELEIWSERFAKKIVEEFGSTGISGNPRVHINPLLLEWKGWGNSVRFQEPSLDDGRLFSEPELAVHIASILNKSSRKNLLNLVSGGLIPGRDDQGCHLKSMFRLLEERGFISILDMAHDPI